MGANTSMRSKIDLKLRTLIHFQRWRVFEESTMDAGQVFTYYFDNLGGSSDLSESEDSGEEFVEEGSTSSGDSEEHSEIR